MELDKQIKSVEFIINNRGITNDTVSVGGSAQQRYRVEGGNSEVFNRGKGCVVILRDRKVYDNFGGGLLLKIKLSAFAVGDGVYLQDKDVEIDDNEGPKLPVCCKSYSIS